MLALWEYFWDESPDWSGIPISPPAPPPESPPNRGSGKNKNHLDYVPLPDEFWEERERSMQKHAPVEPTPEPPSDLPDRIRAKTEEALYAEIRSIMAEQSELASLRDHHAALLGSLRKAPGVAELTEMANKVSTIEPELARIDKSIRERIVRAKSLRFKLLN